MRTSSESISKCKTYRRCIYSYLLKFPVSICQIRDTRLTERKDRAFIYSAKYPNSYASVLSPGDAETSLCALARNKIVCTYSTSASQTSRGNRRESRDIVSTRSDAPAGSRRTPRRAEFPMPIPADGKRSIFVKGIVYLSHTTRLLFDRSAEPHDTRVTIIDRFVETFYFVRTDRYRFLKD